MSTPRIAANPRMTHDIVRGGHISDQPFLLLDVGASGGIEAYWRNFGTALRAIGFDPLVKECDRLNRTEAAPGISYRDGFVGVDRPEDDYAKPDNVRREARWEPNVYGRSSAIAAMKLMNASSRMRYNSNDPEVRFSEKHFSLDTFLLQEGCASVDFIKVDTDGYDFEVLTGARETLRQREVLGLLIECQFHGRVHRHANVFSNIDPLLRAAGFSLYDLELYRYTRADLPGRFTANVAAQTTGGQLLWADALYLRDYADDGYATRWGAFGAEKVLKLACLYEMYGIFDCAVELLQKEASGTLAGLPVARWIDLLTEEIAPGSGGYDRHLERFKANPRAFFPEKAAPPAAPTPVGLVGRLARRLRARRS